VALQKPIVLTPLLISCYNAAMSKESDYPMNQVVERLYRCGFSDFNKYRKHAEPLQLQAQGQVLIIGPGEFFEELALIEKDIANNRVKNIKIIGTNGINAFQVMQQFHDSYKIPIDVSGSSYGQMFDNKPELIFDTILFLGTPLSHAQDTLNYLAGHLNVGGKAYFTVNAFKSPEPPPEVKDCSIKIIDNIPTNPNYNWVPYYYGVVIEKLK